MGGPTPGLLRDRVWIRASVWAIESFTCDAHKPNGDRCDKPVAWIIALADGSGPELGVCKTHALATGAKRDGREQPRKP